MATDKKIMKARSRKQLAKSFARVPLGLKLLGGPLDPSNREIRTLDEQLATRPRAVRRRHPVGAGGRPHQADEVVRVDRRVREDWRRLSGVMAFARGWVRHPDHNPLYLEHWRRVVRNLEVGAAEQDRLRLQWID